MIVALGVAGLAACGSGMAPVIDKGAFVAPAQPTVVTVAAGDTLHELSRRHGVTLPDLVAENQLRPPYVIVPGQRLRLPPPSAVTVQPGDTLYGISRRHGVDMASLARVNGLAPPYVILAGTRLVLPAAASVGAEPGAAGFGPGAVAAQAARAAIAVQAARPEIAALPPPAARDSGRFAWPVQGPVLAGFGPQGGGIHNDGIDIAVAAGTPVAAAENGVVAYAGNELRGLGNLLLILHADGWVTAYAHTGSILVRRGDRVSRGQLVATSGIAELAGTPLLHFEIRRGTQAVDPLDYLGVAVGALAQPDPRPRG